jgi:hypothetical protein
MTVIFHDFFVCFIFNPKNICEANFLDADFLIRKYVMFNADAGGRP